MKVNYKILDMQNKMYRKIVQKLLFFAIVFLGSINFVMAQDVMTKIKDGSAGATERTPAKGAILELESLNKGFLTPRMTTAQRDAINVTSLNHGMLIFNTTTNCFNYYDAKLTPGDTSVPIWLSICGTPPPAVFGISAQQCAEIKMPKILKQGDPLEPSDFMVVGVTVLQAGTYDILAMTNNGYYFSESGTFPATGTYTIVLHGTGTPSVGYGGDGLPGDNVKFTLNGKTVEPNCADKMVLVTPSAVDYIINCASKEVIGKYYIGVPVTPDNYVKYSVDVTTSGSWVIKTPKVNGISFSGSGTFTTAEAASNVPVDVYLLANGTPIASETHNYGFSIVNSVKDNANPTKNVCDFDVKVEDVSLSILCNDANTKVHGTYTQDTPVSSGNFMTVQVDVKATGKASFSTDEINGVSFATESEIAFGKLGKHLVTLKAKGTPKLPSNDQTVHEYVVKASKGLATTETPCKVVVPVVAQPISYSMLCNDILAYGSYSPHSALTASNYIEIKINVTYPGKVSISTDTQNGVTFKSELVDVVKGPNTIKLLATGTAETGGPFTFTVKSNSTEGNTTCEFDITFLYRTMRILGLGHGVYNPGTGGSESSARGILQNKNNFGPNGTVQVQNMIVYNTVIEGAFQPGRTNDLRNTINNDKIDIIVLSHNFIPLPAEITILEDFVKNKKGVLIHAQENERTSVENLINAIGDGSVTLAPGRGNSIYNQLNTAASDVVLDGPFKKLIPETGKAAMPMGSDVNNSFHVSTIFGAGEDFKTLYTNESGDLSWMIKHKSLGYIYCGDSGWIAGSNGNADLTVWPAGNSGGKPIAKNYTGGGWFGGKNVYNSYLYANIMAWAIQYVQDNTKVDYQVQ